MRIINKGISSAFIFTGLLFTLTLVLPSGVHSQALSECALQASDADGDGIGREFDVNNGRFSNCLVTTQSQAAPAFTNRETGAPVTLMRAYWDPNADLANRTLQCDSFIFDDDTEQYVAGANGFVFGPVRDGPYSVFHYPLSSTPPHIGTALGFIEGKEPTYIPLWSVDDGVYNGPAPMALSPYVEVVNFNGGSDNAIRIWDNGPVDYYLCYDTGGDAVVPTGSPGVFTESADADPAEQIVTMLPPSQESSDPPPYTNLETGLEVQLVEPRWNYNADLALRRISCNTYRWNGLGYEHDAFIEFDIDYVFHPRNGDTARVTTSVTDDRIFLNTEELAIVDGQLQQQGFGRVELLDQAVRVWRSNFNYDQCTSVKLLGVGEPLDTVWTFPNEFRNNFFESLGYTPDDPVDFGPTGDVSSGGCDYTQAALHNGWGWNAVLRESCAPISQNACDYSDASEHNGWGWDPVAGSSCPPLAESGDELVSDPAPDEGCDYSNAASNNGWGWNPVTSESCAPIEPADDPDSSNCDYSNAALNNGWGWDNIALQSCAPAM